MAESKGPGALGSTPGNTGTATHSTETNSTTGGIVGKVREQATAQLSSQKDKATEGLGSVAQAVRQTTQHLRDNQHETVAHYAEQAAEQIERFSQGLKNKDIGELMSDAQRLARRQPALFVGGAFALGLLGARFLKSSSPDNRDSYGGYGDSGYGGSNRGGGNYGRGSYGYPGAGTAGYGDTGYGTTGYDAGSANTSGRGLSGGGLGSSNTDFGSSGASSGTSEAMRGNSATTSGSGLSDPGGRGTATPRKGATTSNKRADYPPTEGL